MMREVLRVSCGQAGVQLGDAVYGDNIVQNMVLCQMVN